MRSEKLSVKDRISLAAGTSFWRFGALPRYDIEGILTADGPSGLRKQRKDTGYTKRRGSEPATCFPSEGTLACSFDPELAFRVGKAIGEECRKAGVDMLLGPAVNSKRNPLGGRNFEYFSEDPTLTGILASAIVNGLASVGVMACVKHFAGNNQETRRTRSNSVISERALHDLYLKAFRIILEKSSPAAIMAAYNRLNGRYCCENEWLLTDYLRHELKFNGVVMSDWGAIRRHVASFNAGLDVEMPGGVNRHEAYLMAKAVEGKLSQKRLEEISERVLDLDKRAEENRRVPYACSMQEHRMLAKEAALSSMVLLTNRGSLPLDTEERILVLGEMAKQPRIQGSGSSKVNTLYKEPAWHFLHRACKNADYLPGYRDRGTAEENEALLKEALAAAPRYDKVVIFAGLPEQYESEGLDREHLSLPHWQNTLISRIAACNGNTVAVIAGGGPVLMPWADKVNAILMAFLAGSSFGSAVSDLLTGKENPCGKLSETFPADEYQLPQEDFPSDKETALYNEDIYTGYRWFDREGLTPAFPFGHGLSYTNFEASEPEITDNGKELEIRLFLENTGNRPGKEVVQLYTASEKEPALKILRAFSKIFLQPKERRQLTFNLPYGELADYDTESHGFSAAGRICVKIGFSSRDIRLEEEIELSGTYFRPLACEPVKVYEDRDALPSLGLNTTLRDVADSPVGRVLVRLIEKAAGKMNTDFVPEGRIMDLLMDSPVRQIPLGTQGRISLSAVRKLMRVIRKISRRKKE